MSIRLSLVIAIIITLATVTAAEAFSVAPLRWQIAVAPGKEQFITVTITNDEAVANTFSMAVSGVKQDDRGLPVFGNGFDDAEQWLVPQPTNIKLVSGEKKKITVTVRPALNAEPGTHYAALMIKKNKAQLGTVGVTGQTAVLVEVNVAGVVHESLSINTWSAEKKLATKPVWKTEIELQNTGTISLPLSGKIQVNDWRGRRVAEESLSLGNSFVPGAKRVLAPDLIESFFWPGPYQVDLLVTYGRSQAVARASQTIWYIPAWSISVSLISIVMVLFALRLIKKPVAAL